jgi:thiamine kinase-like enzyme
MVNFPFLNKHLYISFNINLFEDKNMDTDTYKIVNELKDMVEKLFESIKSDEVIIDKVLNIVDTLIIGMSKLNDKNREFKDEIKQLKTNIEEIRVEINHLTENKANRNEE